jgi:hypothetical protein
MAGSKTKQQIVSIVLPEENYSRPKPALRRAWENGIYHYTEA